jgi:hypothetical protein
MMTNISFVSDKKLAIGRLIGFALLVCVSIAHAQLWQPAPTFPGQGAGTAILRTDGIVMVQELTEPASQGGQATGNWYELIPDSYGSYGSGSWDQILTLPSGYGPLYFASAVLPDGRVIVEGGEYNLGVRDFTTLGAIYSTSGKWSSVKSPSPWTAIGDAPSVVLPNGTFMLGDCCSYQEALLDAKNLTWSATGAGKEDPNSEEGWTLLPNGKVLTIDTQNGTNSELYDPSTGTWSNAGNLKVPITYNCGNSNIVPEIGPAVLRPDGTVLATGANGSNAIYNSKTGKWSKGPLFPPNSSHGENGIADGPAALLPNGHVLVMTSPINPCDIPPSNFFSFDGTKFDAVPEPPNAPNEVSYDGRMVELPTGHILFTDGTQDVEIYEPTGSPDSSWAPTITSYPKTISRTDKYTISGTQFNGLSQGAAYGDDAQSASNFPLVRVTNNATGHITYATTSNFSNMGVATGKTVVSADFTLYSGTDTGASTLEVVTNGIASKSVNVTVK